MFSSDEMEVWKEGEGRSGWESARIWARRKEAFRSIIVGAFVVMVTVNECGVITGRCENYAFCQRVVHLTGT